MTSQVFKVVVGVQSSGMNERDISFLAKRYQRADEGVIETKYQHFLSVGTVLDLGILTSEAGDEPWTGWIEVVVEVFEVISTGSTNDMVVFGIRYQVSESLIEFVKAFGVTSANIVTVCWQKDDGLVKGHPELTQGSRKSTEKAITGQDALIFPVESKVGLNISIGHGY